MPTLAIELTEEEAACLWSNFHDPKDLSEIGRRILLHSANEYRRNFPNEVPQAIDRYRQAHPSPTQPPSPIAPSFHGTLTLSTGHTPPPILQLQPGDVILLQTPHTLKEELAHTILTKTKDLFPDHRVMIFSGGLHLTAVRPDPSDPSELPDPPP